MRFATRLSALALAAAGMVAAAGAQAQSMDVRVTGTVTPPACVPTLAGGGVVDYGRIDARSLNRTEPTILSEKEFPFSIACQGSTRVWVRTFDNREASRVSGIVSALGSVYTNYQNFGLGAVGDTNVGGYVIRFKQDTFTADGADVRTVHTGLSGSGWFLNLEGGALQNLPQYRVSWSTSFNPIAFSNLAGTLSVTPVLVRSDALPLQDEVPLDGLVTLEMVYP
ncbi:DUF1120 domain-containing protein [Oceanisphaera sp. KMM 10153]|uniref:DUF1120 domain-containing protein n=1 Tax=Oceanisphaera submarina TaxID=3390193 RepID=UPI003975D0F8